MNKELIKKIPVREEEKPVYQMSGHVFTHPAWHCRPEHLWPNNEEEVKPEWEKAMVLYLANFAEPWRNLANQVMCFACGDIVTGPYGMKDWRTQRKLDVDTGTKTLEGRCTGCGYPMRANHEIRLPSGELVVKLEWFPLFYHPSATGRGSAIL